MRNRAGETIQKVAGGVNEKVTCEDCQRRRFGGTYEIKPQKMKGE